VPVSGVPSHGDPRPVAPGQAEAVPDREGSLGEQVRVALAGLDEAELAAHPEAFEALGAAIVAELRRLEEL
jgi:hypothetical protein